MLIGRFYFKLTSNGNLVGEYSHRDPSSQRCYAEAATRTSPGGIGWCGEYRTTWCEGPSFEVVSAWLKIEAVTAQIFVVRWLDGKDQNQPLFYGEAMICDGILMGDYSAAT